ncbi:uncharacterized protein METZ01_LOCUS350811 [marine metagenome]|uniref:Protoporphyrinogen IX oxidase n=1 Tax=marine metagenome TaxID=408172 RepID=A0A382RLF9_9ZZZZ
MQLASGYLWWKALHIAFMVTWFAGLFYLPRLFIYHAESSNSDDRIRFTLMERRLFVIMTIGAILTAVFGFLMLVINQTLLFQYWFQVKLVLLVGMVIFHIRCRRWISVLEDRRLPKNTKWLRWFNEIPIIFLLTIICLAIIKPF